MTTVALSEIVDFYSGGTPSKSNAKFWDGQIPWFSAKDIKRSRLTQSVDHVSEAAFRSAPLRKLPAGTVVMVVRGMILAHTVPIGMLEVDAAINQDLKALLPRQDLEPTYLAAMLRAQHDELLAHVSTAAHGTKKLDSRVLENLRIPLPGRGEQRRIAGILDRADTLRVKRRGALARLDELAQSLFREMFGDVIRNHRRECATTKLQDVAEIASGITKGRKLGAELTRTVPYMDILNVQDRRLDLSVVKRIAATETEITRYLLRDGDILLTEEGDPDKLGRGTVWRSAIPACIHQNHIFRVRIERTDLTTPVFLN